MSPYASLLLTALLAPAAPLPADEAALDALVVAARRTWQVPGVAVAVVRDGRTIYLHGHGVRAVGKTDPVTPDTLFALSSCSKAFTTAAIARLSDEGKLSWDDPVRRHLPWFRLADPAADRAVTLRDLACHRTGLAEHELLWYRAPWSPEEAVRRAGRLPLDAPFRSRMQYQSSLFTAAGLAAAAAADTGWSELIRTRLLTPLGMRRTCLSPAETRAADDVAAAHQPDRVGEAAVIAGYQPAQADPAITVHSSARDLAAWLRFHLTGGLADGRRLVSSRAMQHTHAPHIEITLSPSQKKLFPDSRRLDYALGWVVYDRQGVRLIGHGGAIDGFRCQLLLAPEQNLGIAVLANLDHSPLPVVLANTLLDRLLDLKPRDWAALHQQGRVRRAAELAEQRRRWLAERQHGTRPSLPLPAYVGTYDHPAYGTAEIVLRRGRLVWRWRDEEAVLEHFHNDTFAIANDYVEDPDLTFAVSGGTIRGLALTGKLNVTFRKSVPLSPRNAP